MALVLNILKQEIIEANTILKNYVVAGVIMITYTNALTRTTSYQKIQYFDERTL